MKLGSLFDGSGGFPLSGVLCGITPAWAAEVEPYPIAVTRSRFPNMKHLGDISKVNGADIEPVDLITFGSPCQDLSVAGKRAGLKHEANGDDETTRSGLFMEAVRIIKEMRAATNGEYPRFALWENVPGAFSSNKGEDFRIVCEELIKIVEPSAFMPAVPEKGWPYSDSYIGDGWSLAYRVFDAQYWGVPQRRRRIHLVIDFGGQCAREVLFEREGVRGYFAEGRSPWQGAPTHAEGCSGADDRQSEVGERGECGNSGGGRQLDAGGGRQLDAVGSAPICMATQQGGAEIRTDDKAPTLTAAAGMSGNNQPVIAIDKASFSSGQGFNRKPGIVVGGPCATLQASGQHAVCYPTTEGVVCYDARGNGDGKTTNTVTGDHNNRITDYSAVVVEPVYCLQGNGIDRPAVAYGVGNGQTNQSLSEELVGALNCMHDQQAVIVPEGNFLDVEMEVAVRKYAVDCERLCRCLRIHKLAAGLSNKEIAEKLDLPLTQVEHWFRQDQHFAIPDPDVWPRLKKLLDIEVVDFDQSIMEFEFKGGSFDTRNRIHLGDTSPTLTCGCGNDLHLLPKEPTCVADHPTPKVDEKGTAFTLSARDYKNPQALAYPTPRLRYIVRRLTPTECARLQGFADWHGHLEQKTDLTDEEHSFWMEVRNTHAAINGKAVKDYTKAQMLTWYNKLWTDSAEYKMWGNGIALPPALYCMQGIADVLNREEEDAWML